jgi:hypothetical protein
VTVEQAEVIDALGIDKETGASMLTIADHLPWGEPLEHHRDCLERKLEAYIRFINGGQLREHHPDAKTPTILLLMLHRPSDRGLKLLKSAQCVLEEREIAFRYGPGPDGYTADS